MIIFTPKVIYVAIKFEEIEVTGPVVTYVVITLYTTGILPFIVVYTMFTFSIVVIDIGVLYFVQVIGGGLCPLHKLLGGVSPLCPLPTSMYVTYVRLLLFPNARRLHVATCHVYGINVFTLRHRSTLQCLFLLAMFHSPIALNLFVVVYKIHCSTV